MLTASKLKPSDVSRQVAELFTTTAEYPTEGPGQVGLELEWIPARPDRHPPGTIPADTLRKLLDNDPTLVDQARVTFEHRRPAGDKSAPLPDPNPSSRHSRGLPRASPALP